MLRMTRMYRTRLIWLALSAGILLADQVSKGAVLAALLPFESIPVTSFFNLVLVFNEGAAFSFLADMSGWQRPLFAGISIAAIVVCLIMICTHSGGAVYSCALSLIIGGAAGNLYDRITLGRVVDFLDFHLVALHWPAFNVADISICLGAFLLILVSLFESKRDGVGAK